MKLRKNRKSATEIISFIIITLIISTVGIFTYEFSKNYFLDILEKNEFESSKKNIVEITNLIDSISFYENSSKSINIKANFGVYLFRNDTIFYLSKIQSTSDLEACNRLYCNTQINNKQALSIKLKNNFTFSQEIEIYNDNSFITFINQKSKKKILLVVN